MAEIVDEKWKQMELSYRLFQQAVDAFLACTKEQRVEAIQTHYQSNRALTITLLSRFVTTEDLEDLLPFLLSQAESIHAYLWAFQSIILRIPKDWLATHIEGVAEPFLKTGDDCTFRRFLELYFEIDRSLTLRLAERAVASNDADIREAGEDFLERIVT